MWAAEYMKLAAEKAPKPPPPPTPADKLVFAQQIRLMNKHMQQKQAMPFSARLVNPAQRGSSSPVQLPLARHDLSMIGSQPTAPRPVMDRLGVTSGIRSDKDWGTAGIHSNPPEGSRLVTHEEALELAKQLPTVYRDPSLPPRPPPKPAQPREPWGHGTAAWRTDEGD